MRKVSRGRLFLAEGTGGRGRVEQDEPHVAGRVGRGRQREKTDFMLTRRRSGRRRARRMAQVGTMP